MKVKSVDQMRSEEKDRCIIGDGFESIRFILMSDNMGFSLHKTIIPKGGPYHWHYKHHKEACFCVSGHGILKNLDNGSDYVINKDSIYILDSHDNHEFTAIEDVELISVFNPPVIGNEIHDNEGSYPSPYANRQSQW